VLPNEHLVILALRLGIAQLVKSPGP
jgi:hypothetical protein